MLSPVTMLAAGEAKNATTSATSSTVRSLPTGMRFDNGIEERRIARDDDGRPYVESEDGIYVLVTGVKQQGGAIGAGIVSEGIKPGQRSAE